MRVLLTAINAKYIHSNLAVYSLRAFAGPYRPQVELREYTINQQPDEVLREIYRARPDFLCFSCYIWNISFVRELCIELKKILPDTRIWLGGPEVSYDARKTLEELPQVEGIFLGEGEATFREWLPWALEGKGKAEEIKGLVFRDCQGEIRDNGFRDPIDLDQVPFVYEDLDLFRHKIIYYESSRGCPFSCSYCLSSVDKRLRFRSLELVKRELLFFLENRVPQVKLVDRTFNCNHSRTKEIWSFLLEHDNGVTNFHFEISGDLLDQEEIALLGKMRPGLVQLEIGVQTTNPQTLQEIRRKMDFPKLADIVEQIRQGHNVHQHLDLIAGLPYEGYDSFKKSFNDVYALRPQQLQLGFLKVLKGSFLHSQAAEYGCLYHHREPYEVLSTRWISYDELVDLKQVEEMVEVYYNSGQFTCGLPVLEEAFADAFSFYQALGNFYQKQGYFSQSHTRIRRYEILLEFSQKIGGEKLKQKLTEYLVCDLYLRENLKSRPEFAALPDRDRIRAFYQEKARSYLKGYEQYEDRQISRMTHLEYFREDVLRVGRERYWVLFDYLTRDPLDYSAFRQVIPEEEMDEAYGR